MHGWNLFPAVVDEVPLGERIGPFIFWPLLVLLLGVIVWTFVKKSRQSNGLSAHSAPGKTWTDPEDYREHHRVVWSRDPSAFAPTDADWRLAVAAVLGICSGDPWDELAHANLDSARSGLQEAWGIRSRAQLLSRLHWILREGHRVGFDREIAAWSASDQRTSAEAAAQAAASAEVHDGGDHARERAWRLQQVLADTRGIRDVKFEAWDLARAAMLCRAGYSLGWLSEAEAVDTLNLLAAHLQRTFSGWGQLGEHFSRAGWYWGGHSGLEARQEDAHDISRQAALLDPRRGPWAHVPWDQPIPSTRFLLVDALVGEGLVADTPADSPTPLARMIDEATEARLDARL